VESVSVVRQVSVVQLASQLPFFPLAFRLTLFANSNSLFVVKVGTGAEVGNAVFCVLLNSEEIFPVGRVIFTEGPVYSFYI
jgi:hypothetical protein